MNTTEKQIRDVIDSVRPYLQQDGGDIQFVKFEDGIVYVGMLGACTHCASKSQTLDDIVEATLLEKVAGVIGVEAI